MFYKKSWWPNKVASTQNVHEAMCWVCPSKVINYDNQPKLFLSSGAKQNKTILMAVKTLSYWFTSLSTKLRIIWTDEDIFNGNWLIDDNSCIAFTGDKSVFSVIDF